MPRLIAALFLALTVVVPAHAQAQAGSAEAEQLFRDGKRLMQDKKYGEACAAFETSYKLDSVVATLLNLADCREKNGQLASAWGHFVDAERETRGDSKRAGLNKTAGTRAKALEPRLSYLTVSVPDESRIEGLVILRNGVELDEGLWNRAVPVDGGEIVIAGRAPGHEEWSTTAKVPNDSGKISVEVPRFKEIRTLDKPVPPDSNPEQEKPVPVEPRPEGPGSGTFTGQRKIAVGIAIVGVAAVGFGGWMGVQAKDYDGQAFDLCPDASMPCADADEATALSERAGSRALYANIGFGVGAAAVIGAAVLWLTGGPDESPTRTAIVPAVNAHSAGLALTGSF